MTMLCPTKIVHRGVVKVAKEKAGEWKKKYEVRSKMTNLERYAILSSSREGILNFHLGYI
ncbi:hypothetical protein LEP1GSC199_0102 [Leptospira vanthielii serovar Holland str. Waz Holland = ATCC 700522]|uniref:Transposase DDE domain protein n=1 Tax=Leptospira vanthielii serovar Holland str. Waz Holland = ATCC 700522 TaxID=1218591 RepID=N1W6G6_9LEPT|nr:hypothetical protein LEP1GSC199_0102 [Leptospira vanthielii serovar Holland str. Waz Holland = ATCC 700522]